MLEVTLTLRDGSGHVVDPAAIGVARLVGTIRAGEVAAGPVAPAGPPGEDQVDTEESPAMRALLAVEHASRQLAAVRAACVAAVADDTPGGASTDEVLDELACALVVSRRSAQFTRGVAETLRNQPDVWAALSQGAIDATRARILADALYEIPEADSEGVARQTHDAECAELLRAGLEYGREHTARRLEVYLRRLLAGLGCGEQPRRRARALGERGVWLAHRGDGTADLTARLASEDAERVYSAIRACALADRNGDTSDAAREPMDVWLAAALVDIVLGPAGGLSCSPPEPGARSCAPGSDSAAGGVPRAPRAHVSTVINVTVPVESLAGLSEAPGLLSGFGVIPAETARRLAAGDARWRQVLTCRTSGAVLDVGTSTYRPPAALARHVRLRDGTCRFPGCAVPASECDLDHLIPFPDGPTSAGNLHALCRGHHRLKHEGGWRVESGPGHSLRWTSPQGASVTTHPDDTHAHAA